MLSIYDTLRRADHVICSLNDDRTSVAATAGATPPLRASIECVDRLGQTILVREVSGLEIRPTSDHESDVYLNSRKGRTSVREYLGSTDDLLKIPFEEQIAVMELGREAGFPPKSEAYGTLSSLDLLRSLAEDRSRLAVAPELRAVRETVLWDDAWYSDIEAFALDFEELGGDATDERALQAFVDQRLTEDFQTFLAAVETTLDGTDASRSMLMALETSEDRAGFPGDHPVKGLAATVTSGTIERALASCSLIRFIDYMGDLILEAPPRSFMLRRVDEEQAANVRRINSGLERESSLAQVWGSAGRLYMGRSLKSLEQDRSVALELSTMQRCGNEPLSAQIEDVRNAPQGSEGHGSLNRGRSGR